VKKRILLLALLLGLVAVSMGTATVQADDGQPVNDDEVNKVASQLYCPICENIPLDVCPTQACADWRELIRGFLAEGKTEAEIKDYFSTQYGWNVLAVPPRAGLNWLIYVLPPAIILAGVVAVVIIIRRSKPSTKITTGSTEVSNSSKSTNYQAIIDRDLQNEERNG
jgi:cytochrome c-type biogenesis protein CcmH